MNISKSAPEETQASFTFSYFQFLHQPHFTVSFHVTLTSSLPQSIAKMSHFTTVEKISVSSLQQTSREHDLLLI